MGKALTDEMITEITAQLMGWHFDPTEWAWKDEENHWKYWGVGFAGVPLDTIWRPRDDLNQAFKLMSALNRRWHLDYDKLSNTYLVTIDDITVVDEIHSRAICFAAIRSEGKR